MNFASELYGLLLSAEGRDEDAAALLETRYAIVELGSRLRKALDPFYGRIDFALDGWPEEVGRALFDLHHHFRIPWDRYCTNHALSGSGRDEVTGRLYDPRFTALEQVDTSIELEGDAYNLRISVLKACEPDLYPPQVKGSALYVLGGDLAVGTLPGPDGTSEAAALDRAADRPPAIGAMLRPPEVSASHAASDRHHLTFTSSTPPCLDPDVFDALPEPGVLTVGQALCLIETSAHLSSALAIWSDSESREAVDRELASVDSTGLMERLRLANDPAPILKDAWERREIVLFEGPGIADLERFANNECNSPLSLRAAQEFRRRLAMLLGKSWSEVDAMPLVEAVGRISHTQPADLPTGEVRSSPRQAPAAGPPVGTGDATPAAPTRPPGSDRSAAVPADPPRADGRANGPAPPPCAESENLEVTGELPDVRLATRGKNPPDNASDELPEVVTLDQAAALVNRMADGLRHYRKRGMPKPFVRGTKGKPNEYLWSEMRPWLETTFDRKIPEVSILKFRLTGR